eukprot:TRINITY_DN37242_c0_g5_i1.p1 TRINITY_DN37242_c0_g5~~TRINITY_DN37242_c0_g5_i1.p1  ORF type:complete len:585 (+),score=157.89 TRINITY_DN37242_c0_g5_i1:92-1846(+)
MRTGAAPKRGGGSSRLVLDRYEIGPLLGTGSFARVYRGTDLRVKRDVAIKMIQINNAVGGGGGGADTRQRYLENLQSEIEAMIQVGQHPNIVQLYDQGKTESFYILVLEFCGGGDVARLIKKCGGPLPESLVRRLAGELAAGLQCLRKNNISHRDLKPQNLLLTSLRMDDCHLKIGDFGFARQTSANVMMETLCGTPLYMAPELLKHEKYDASADLWSVGTILFEMATGKAPYSGENYIDLSKNIEKYDLQFPSNVTLSDDCVSLLKGLLKRVPSERMTYEQFFSHPFIVQDPLSSDDDKDDFVSIDASDFGLEAGFPAAKKEKDSKEQEQPGPVSTEESGVPVANEERRRYRNQMSFVNVPEAEELFRKLLSRATCISRCGEEHLNEAERYGSEGRQRGFSMDESELFSQNSSQSLEQTGADQELLVSFAILLESLYILSDALCLLKDWRTAIIPSYSRNPGGSAELLSKIDGLTREILKKYNDVVGRAGRLRELIESEGLEKSRVPSVEEILYNKAVKAGGDAAVDETMRDWLRAEKKYEEACMILGHIKEGFQLDVVDSKVIESYVVNFQSRLDVLRSGRK